MKKVNWKKVRRMLCHMYYNNLDNRYGINYLLDLELDQGEYYGRLV